MPGGLASEDVRLACLEPGDIEPGGLAPGDIEPGDIAPGDIASGDVGLACLALGGIGPGGRWPAGLGAVAGWAGLLTMDCLLACVASDVLVEPIRCGGSAQRWWLPAGCEASPHHTRPDLAGGPAVRRPGVEGGGRQSCLMPVRARECPDWLCGTSRAPHGGSPAAKRGSRFVSLSDLLAQEFEPIEHSF